MQGDKMAVRFEAAFWRNMWLVLLVSYVIDVVVVYVAMALFNVSGTLIIGALLFPIAVYVLQAALAFYNMLKRLAWFQLFEKTQRIRATIADFRRLKMPVPKDYYPDGDQYLMDTAMSEDASAEARLYAGSSLGMLASQRQYGPRTEAFLNGLVLENAVQQYVHDQPEITGT